MKKIFLAMLCSGSIFCTGCADDGSFNKTQVGTVSGAAIGGVLGSTLGHGRGHTVGAIGGSIIGAFIGGNIGKYMDDVDKMKMNHALEKNATGETTTWVNPDTHRHYEMTVTRTFVSERQRPCREFVTKAYINGRKERVYGTACRQANGRWRMVK